MTGARRELASASALIAVVGVLGVTLALQGWRSRVPGTDLIPYIDAARDFLSNGRLPDHGVVTGYSSYAPPGLAWVVMPGMALLSEPRLFDVPGNVLLHVATLVGIYMLARAVVGVRGAVLSVLVYGLSERALIFAGTLGPGSLGPRGHPCFYVWMAYFTSRWVTKRDARYLAAALATWLVGMYVFMEIAAGVFMLPVVWFFHRPPVRLKTLVAAGALGLLIWLPYLRFEASRGFADLRSQILLQSIKPSDYRMALCDPSLSLLQWAGTATLHKAAPIEPANPIGRALLTPGRRILAIAGGLVVNFGGLVPAMEFVLLALTLAGLMVLCVRQTASRPAGASRPRLTGLAIGLLAASAIANELVAAWLLGARVALPEYIVVTIRTLQVLLALGGAAVLARRPIAAFLKTLATRSEAAARDRRVLALTVITPWLGLLLVAEWGRQDRLVGLWALQAVVLATLAAVVMEAPRRGVRFAGWALPLLIVGVAVANPFVVSRIEAWRREGWSGIDAAEVRVAGHLASLVRAEGRERAVVGHRLFLESPPEPPGDPIDGRWRVGGEFDVILEYRHGIENLNRCGEGLSARDEYRIVEASPSSPEAPYYFDVPAAGPLRFLERIGAYDLYKRD